MSDVLNRAKEHFSLRLEEEKYVLVPEWGTEKDGKKIPLKIFYKPMSLKTQDRIFKHVQAGTLKSLAETLIQRALNEDGSKMFKPVHMTELMGLVDPEVIETIVSEMAGGYPDIEEAEKN